MIVLSAHSSLTPSLLALLRSRRPVFPHGTLDSAEDESGASSSSGQSANIKRNRRRKMRAKRRAASLPATVAPPLGASKSIAPLPTATTAKKQTAAASPLNASTPAPPRLNAAVNQTTSGTTEKRKSPPGPGAQPVFVAPSRNRGITALSQRKQPALDQPSSDSCQPKIASHTRCGTRPTSWLDALVCHLLPRCRV